MNRRIGVLCLILWLLFSAFAAPGSAGQAKSPRESEEVRDFRTFTDRVQAYVQMQKALEASLPALKLTKNPTQIVERQHELASKIVEARRAARQGDLFTPEVTKRFRKIIRKEFRGPEGRLARKTILSDSSHKSVVLHVNDVFPDDIPVTTTPPTLLLKLPELPPDLVYRIVGHDLTLQATKARLVVDLIPNAIP